MHLILSLVAVAGGFLSASWVLWGVLGSTWGTQSAPLKLLGDKNKDLRKANLHAEHPIDIGAPTVSSPPAAPILSSPQLTVLQLLFIWDSELARARSI